MAIKKPKVAKKPNFDIGDILKFVESQAIGSKAEGLFKEAGNIPMPDVSQRMTGQGQWLGGISPTTLALGAKAGKGLEGLANTGIGQWFGADAAYNLIKPNRSPSNSASDLANILFSYAPLGGGGMLKKGKGAVKGAGVGVEEMRSIIKLLLGRQHD